jgi:hypothetical protein
MISIVLSIKEADFMKLRHSIVILTLCIVLAGSLSCRKDSPANQHSQTIIGKWTSIELGGSGIGGHIKDLTCVFGKDRSVTMQATMADGSKMEHSGSYTLSESIINITLDNGDSQAMPYQLKDDILQMEDPQLNSWIKYEKI